MKFYIKITFLFLVLTSITDTAFAIWNNNISTPSMFKDDKLILDIFTPIGEEFNVNVYPSTLLISFTKNGQLEEVIELLQKGADPNAKDAEGHTSLTFAILQDRSEIKQLLIEWGADPNAALLGAARSGLATVVEQLLLMGANLNLRDPHNGYTPLIWAARQGHLETTQVLLERGADPYLRSFRGYTALIEAVSHGHPEIISVLLDEGVDPSLGIFAAARASHLESMRILLERGADPNQQSNDESTPLTIALLYNDNTEFAEMLLAFGADPNISLPGAVKNGSPVVESLLEVAGADPDLQDHTDSSLFMLAVYRNHLDTAKILYERGADPNLPDKNGNTPLMLAALQDQLLFVEFLLGLEEIDIHSPNRDGYTALMRAVANNDSKIITALLDAGADPNTQDSRGQVALMGTAYNGNLEAMVILLAEGADPNIQDKDGYTSLMSATYNDDVEVVTTLLDWGADPTIKDHEGYTAAWWANDSNNPNVAALLEEAIEKWNQKKNQQALSLHHLQL